MAQNEISIVIQAQDNASRVLQGVAEQVKDTGSKSATALQAIQNATGGLNPAMADLNAHLVIAKQRLAEAEQGGRASASTLMSLHNEVRTTQGRLDELAASSGKAGGAFDSLSAKSAVVMGAVAGAAQMLVFEGINLITTSVSDAIKRVDTLNNSNRTFENMGFSAQATKNMMHELDLSIRGLPTTLSDAVAGVELLTGSTNDIGQSRKIFDALNDGIIGFGGSTVQVNGAIIQLSQAFSNGRVDAQTWNSLIQNGMGPALDALARKMGLTIGQFKDGLSTGKISVSDFQNALIELDTKGGGGMTSLNKIAHDATSGIGTGMENAKTAVTRGIADIIGAIGSKNISNAITDIGKWFEGLGKSIAALISSQGFKNWMHDIGEAIKTATDYIKDASKFYEEHKRVINDVIQVIAALVAAFYVIRTVVAIIDAIKLAWMGLQIVMAMNPILLAIMAVIAIVILMATHWQQTCAIFRQGWSDIKQWFDDGVNFIRQHWTMLVGLLLLPIAPVLGAWFLFHTQIKDAFVDAVHFIENIWNGIVGFFRSTAGLMLAILIGPIGEIILHWGAVTRFFGNLWGMVSGGFASAYNGMVGWARSTVDDIVSFFTGLPGRITRAVGNIAGNIGGEVKSAFHSLHIPGFAAGTNYAPGGLAVVGEHGAEVVDLPPGAQVHTAQESRNMLAGQQVTNVLSGTFNFQSKEAVTEFFNRLDKTQRLARLGMA